MVTWNSGRLRRTGRDESRRMSVNEQEEQETLTVENKMLFKKRMEEGVNVQLVRARRFYARGALDGRKMEASGFKYTDIDIVIVVCV